MIPTLALAAALAQAPSQPPAAAGALSLRNVRVTYGELGAPRPDDKVLPGDIYFIAFDIEGIKVDETGKVSYSMAMSVTDKTNKPIFEQPPANRDEHIPLGGSKLPARAFVQIGLEQEPGTYTCKVTVTDRITKATQTLTRTFEVVKGFGLAGLFTSVDDQGKYPAPPIGVTGQNIWIQFLLVGFGRDKTTKKPNVTVEMRILDERRQPTLPKPDVYVVNTTADEKDVAVPFGVPLPFNREGNFTVEFKASDKTTNKEATLTFPVRVLPATIR